MARSNYNYGGLFLLIIGGALLYFNSVYQACTGWSSINPLCWAGSLITHSIMFWGGIILLIAGIFKVIRS